MSTWFVHSPYASAEAATEVKKFTPTSVVWPKILFNKKLSDSKKNFSQSRNVGLNYLTSVAASVEAYREVGGGLSCKVI